jgi:hypothetical protein
MGNSQELLDQAFSALDISLGDQRQAPIGAHVCLIYITEEERRDLVSKFLKAGLEGGEQVLYFTDVMTPTQLLDWLADMGVDIPCDVESGRLKVSEAKAVYYPNGVFDPQAMLEYWKQACREAVLQGFPSMRATGETSWAVRGIPGSERLIEYEALLNKTLETLPATAFCQYDVNLFDGATILEVLRVHPVVISRGQVVRNPLYVRPDEFLAHRAIKK